MRSAWLVLVAVGACSKRDPAKPLPTGAHAEPIVAAEPPGVHALYETNGCERICGKSNDCVGACGAADDMEASRRCTDACFAKLNARFDACLARCRGKTCYHDCFFTSGCSREMCDVGNLVRTP